MIRSLLGLVIGFALAAVTVYSAVRLSPAITDNPSNALQDPHAWLAVSYAVIAAFAGGYACAWIAGRAEIPHAALLGMLLVFAAILVIQTNSWQQPRWYQFTVAGCAPLAALIAAHTRLFVKRPAVR